EGPGLQAHLGHDPVALHLGDDPAHPVAGGLVVDDADRRRVGDLLGEAGQVRPVDEGDALALRRREATALDPPPDRVRGDREQLRRLRYPHLRHSWTVTAARTSLTSHLLKEMRARECMT